MKLFIAHEGEECGIDARRVGTVGRIIVVGVSIQRFRRFANSCIRVSDESEAGGKRPCSRSNNGSLSQFSILSPLLPAGGTAIVGIGRLY